MGLGGVPIYFGPTQPDAYRFFGNWLERQGKRNAVDNPRDMFDMLNQREQPVFEGLRAQDPNVTRGMARMAAARQWRNNRCDRSAACAVRPACLTSPVSDRSSSELSCGFHRWLQAELCTVSPQR